VAVPRAVVGQQPQDHEPGKIHAISFRRLIAGVKRDLEKMGLKNREQKQAIMASPRGFGTGHRAPADGLYQVAND
jgi:hypothetical protein